MLERKVMERVISSEAASSAGGSLRLARITLQPLLTQTWHGRSQIYPSGQRRSRFRGRMTCGYKKNGLAICGAVGFHASQLLLGGSLQRESVSGE